MNDQVYKIAVETGIIKEQDGYFWIQSVENLEKFAQLIVRECARLAKDKSLSIVEKAELYGEPDEIDTAKATAWQFLVLEQQMKKHFGIES